jgi:hypothetical protein
MSTTTQGRIPGPRRRPGAQTRRPAEWTPELLEKVAWRKRAAAEPFRGVAASEGVRPGLFPLRGTGADVSGARSAALDYLAGLTPPQLAEGRFPIDDVSWRHWSNGARYFLRHGVCLEEFDDRGRERALAIVRASLSEPGYRQLADVMRLNLTIGELRGEERLLNEWLYWFSVYGEPGSPVWGWQLDGHHANVNCVFAGDQMVLTPSFLGAEPVVAESGKYAGTGVFRAEEAVAQQLFDSFDEDQRRLAVIARELPLAPYAGAFTDNLDLDYAGIPLRALTANQRAVLHDLIGLYIERAPDVHARVRWDEVRAHEGETYFAWAGDGGPDSVFYYRVHSPVVLIEFEHMRGVMFDNDVPLRHHVHTIVRTPNGNDYGVDLLRQHHERHHRRPAARGSEQQ